MTRPLVATRLRHHASRSYQDVILADTPLLFWRMNEAAGAGSFADSSGNAHTGNITGTITSGIAGRQRLGNAASFALNSRLTVTNSAPFRILGNISVEAWVMLPTAFTAGSQVISAACGASGETTATNFAYIFDIHYSSASNYGWGYFHESGSGTDNTGQTPFSNTLMPALVWHHVVWRRDTTANTHEFHLNGARVGNAVSYTNDPTGSTSGLFGWNGYPSSSTFSNRAVSWDSCALYSAKLTDAQIFEHYRAGRR